MIVICISPTLVGDQNRLSDPMEWSIANVLLLLIVLLSLINHIQYTRLMKSIKKLTTVNNYLILLYMINLTDCEIVLHCLSPAAAAASAASLSFLPFSFTSACHFNLSVSIFLPAATSFFPAHDDKKKPTIANSVIIWHT